MTLWSASGLWESPFWGVTDDEEIPPPPIPPPASLWHHLEMQWTSWDGTVFSLTNPASSPFITNDGMRGLELPPDEPQLSVAASVHGSQYLGYRIPSREAFLPLFLYNDVSSVDYLAHRRAFTRSLHPGKTGILSVRQPTGEIRSLELRRTEYDSPLNRDPSAFGWQKVGVTLVADWPFWLGAPKIWQTEIGPSVGVFDGPGVLNIAPGSSMSSASIDNPGDEPAWLDWRAEGPFGGAELGVGTSVVEVPALAAGEVRIIRTHPFGRGMFDESGTNLTHELGDESKFAAVASGEKVDLSVSMSSPAEGAKVTASLTPQHLQAY